MLINDHTYRKLLVWQKSMLLVTMVYEELVDFPKEELYGLTAQIKRSAISIPSNVAEGYGRKSTKDYLRFLNISLSSQYELQTQIEIGYNLIFFSKTDFHKIYEST